MQTKAFSILELLISATLTIILSIAALSILQRMIKTKNDLYNYADRTYKDFRIQSLIETAVQNHDQHNLSALAPQIFSAKTVNNTFSLKPSRQAKVNSNALYFINLSWNNLANIVTHRNNSLIACHNSHAQITRQNQIFLGIGLAGLTYLQGTSEISRGNSTTGTCRLYSLTPTKNLLNLQSLEIQKIKILIPVRSENLIYLDQKNFLRIVSIKGLNLRENSLLINNIKKINFSLESRPLLLSYQVKFQESNKLFSGSSLSMFVHTDYRNFLLNLAQ